jgi:hypothetical protein
MVMAVQLAAQVKIREGFDSGLGRSNVFGKRRIEHASGGSINVRIGPVAPIIHPRDDLPD